MAKTFKTRPDIAAKRHDNAVHGFDPPIPGHDLKATISQSNGNGIETDQMLNTVEKMLQQHRRHDGPPMFINDTRKGIGPVRHVGGLCRPDQVGRPALRAQHVMTCRQSRRHVKSHHAMPDGGTGFIGYPRCKRQA